MTGVLEEGAKQNSELWGKDTEKEEGKLRSGHIHRCYTLDILPLCPNPSWSLILYLLPVWHSSPISRLLPSPLPLSRQNHPGVLRKTPTQTDFQLDTLGTVTVTATIEAVSQIVFIQWAMGAADKLQMTLALKYGSHLQDGQLFYSPTAPGDTETPPNFPPVKFLADTSKFPNLVL